MHPWVARIARLSGCEMQKASVTNQSFDPPSTLRSEALRILTTFPDYMFYLRFFRSGPSVWQAVAACSTRQDSTGD